MNYSKSFVEVLERQMSYIKVGEGAPIVFLHGNPTSSYLWRNILPYLEGYGCLIAPDLIGMGDSEKLSADEPERYRFVCHRRYLEAFLTAVGADQDVTLVLHDWGGALGFDWANRHRSSVRAIAYMETFARPLEWSDLPEDFHPTLKAVRSSEGEKLVLEENMFIEKMLPGVTMRELTAEEMENYRRPYQTAGDSRMPTLIFPREVPLDSQPADVASAMSDYSDWLKTSQIPKLFINAEPGVFITGSVREFCRTWFNQTEVTVPGTHFLQEDSPDLIGKAIVQWCDSMN
ncbi:MAG: haloalkane dehalogenase [Cyanobacteria bacterium P01_C01_bin.72]